MDWVYFDVDKKEDVEEECRNTLQDFTWKKNGGLRLVNKRDAFENHPVTGDRVWFNHLQVRNVTTAWNKVWKVHVRLQDKIWTDINRDLHVLLNLV